MPTSKDQIERLKEAARDLDGSDYDPTLHATLKKVAKARVPEKEKSGTDEGT